MLPGQRLCFEQEEREECNTRRCILRTLQGNETIVQAGYKLVVRWEHERPYPRRCKLPCKQNETFAHAIAFDFKAIKTLGKGDAHSRFGFRERARPCISVPCGHVRRRAEAYFSKIPEWAAKKVLGSVGEARRNFEGEDKTKIRAGRLRAIVKKTAGDNTRLVQYNTSAGFQLG